MAPPCRHEGRRSARPTIPGQSVRSPNSRTLGSSLAFGLSLAPIAEPGAVAGVPLTNHGFVFAVGDDWQSIYRFAGADIGLIGHFAEHFGETATVEPDLTFRMPDRLTDLASAFVQRNPVQTPRQIKPPELCPSPSFTSTGVPWQRSPMAARMANTAT